jgi:beta-galactosidase GanA
MVHGQPFLILGGELGNSSAGTARQADAVIPVAARMHVNTLLVPVAREQIEPEEGEFDFSILDHWIDVARENKLHLVPLWFGSWKNAFSNYAPAWVKSDSHRFPRAQAGDGKPLEILSSLSPENRRSDSRAYARLMQHIREKDSHQQTVLMVQVENEVGYLGYAINDDGTSPDWLVIDPFKVQLRSERSDATRLYTIKVTATDSAGATSNQSVLVKVPLRHP